MTKNFDLTPHNTMGLLSSAEYGGQLNAIEEIKYYREYARDANLPLHIIGGGSNLLPHEKVKAVIGIMALKGREITGRTEQHYLVTAAAGEDWSEFVEWTISQGLGGLENMAGIPGTVGAAPIQNIGAYGVELQDRFHSLEAYDTYTGSVKVFSSQDCDFSYRQSIFKRQANRYIVLKVTFALPVQWQAVTSYAGLGDVDLAAGPEAIKNRVLELRRNKLPDWKQLGNSGSFFHNPIVSASMADGITDAPKYPQSDGQVKLSAAWLIESAGLKGFRQGPVGVYEGHALVLVNYGGASFTHIAGLSQTIKTIVKQKFGIELFQEPLEIA